MQIFEDNNKKQYDKILIRKHVLNNFKKNVALKSMMKKKISSSKKSQLFMFDDTSSFESTSISNFVAVEISRFLFRKETSDKKWFDFLKKINHWTKKITFLFERKIFFVRIHRNYRMNFSKFTLRNDSVWSGFLFLRIRSMSIWFLVDVMSFRFDLISSFIDLNSEDYI
jgi:uncharacterized protein VirK/YbjX